MSNAPLIPDPSAADPNLNALWGRSIAEELHRAGCTHVVLCPGSRNSPLLFALAAVFGADAWSWIDERGAAFAALGAAKSSGRPAAVCVTSGTAVANCLPALCEAGAMGVPLMLIAADRPWELQDRGAPQAMAQRGLFTGHAHEVVLGEPVASDAALIALRTKVSRATQRRGPVVLHVPLRDPLPPLPDPSFQADQLSALARHGRDDQPFTTLGASVGLLPPAIDTLLRPGLKGLIVVGADAGAPSARTIDLVQASGFPLLADITSGLRGLAGEHEIVLGDALIGGVLRDATPDLIIRIGPAPLHRGTWEWLARQTCPVIALEDDRNRDVLGTATIAVSHLHDDGWRTLGERLADGDAQWLAQWRDADHQAQRRLHTFVRAEAWSELVAAHIAVNHDGFAHLHAAPSMPVRHANWHLTPRPPHVSHRVFANRGVNGIDGCIATFAGINHVLGGNGLLLIGDLACTHDLNSLALASQWAPGSAIVVLNNDGGGIFDHLPVAQVAGYERLIRTPQGRDFAAAAAQAGLAYARVTDRAALEQALSQAANAASCTLIECDVRKSPNRERHQALMLALTNPTVS